MSSGIEKAPWFDSTWKGGEVSPRAFAVVAPNPSWATFEGTNTWILHEPGIRGCYVVDPGPDDKGHLDRVCNAVRELDCEAMGILLTHGHADHKTGAVRLAQMLDVDVLSREGGNLPDGPMATSEAPSLRVVSLPGHSSDSVGFVFPADSSVVTGDVVLWQASTAVIWPDGNLKDYLGSLDVLEQLVMDGTCTRFLSGHRRPIDECFDLISEYRRHRSIRLDMVRAAVSQLRTDVIADLIPEAYRDVESQYHPLCEFSIRAQLAYLIETGDPCMEGMHFDL